MGDRVFAKWVEFQMIDQLKESSGRKPGSSQPVKEHLKLAGADLAKKGFGGLYREERSDS